MPATPMPLFPLAPMIPKGGQRVRVGSNASRVHSLEYVATGVGSVECEVPADNVIDVPVVVVIHAVGLFREASLIASNFPGVVPEVVFDVLVPIAEAVVQYGDDDCLRTLGNRPRTSDIQIDTGLGGELPVGRAVGEHWNGDFASRIQEAVLVLEVGIVGNHPVGLQIAGLLVIAEDCRGGENDARKNYWPESRGAYRLHGRGALVLPDRLHVNRLRCHRKR